MPHPYSYIVKVYRRRADAMAGTVQDVRTGRTVPFQTMDELWRAIGRPSPASAPPSPKERKS